MYVQKSVLSLALLIFTSIYSVSNATEKTQDYRGYLVDKKCSLSVREDPNPDDFIKHHTKDCCLMENCRRQGYSLYVKPIWYDLDKRGNELAIILLKNSKRRNCFYVRIEGAKKGNLLKVQTITEVKDKSEEDGVETK